MKINQIEQRNYNTEVRSIAEDSRKVEGYALLFGVESNDLGGFTEIIESQALDGVLEISDVFALLNHDRNRGILARCKELTGTLTLTIDNKGLKYEFEAPHTALGDELLEMLKRGDITESSFAFSVDSGGDEWIKGVGDTYLRRIIRFNKIYDVSPVYTPAYNGTKVDCKRFKEIQSIDTEQLKQYYIQLREELKDK